MSTDHGPVTARASTTVRRYVLTIMSASPDARLRLELTRAYDAADARAQWTCRTFSYDMPSGKMIPGERLDSVEPFDESNERHRALVELDAMIRSSRDRELDRSSRG